MIHDEKQTKTNIYKWKFKITLPEYEMETREVMPGDVRHLAKRIGIKIVKGEKI